MRAGQHILGAWAGGEGVWAALEALLLLPLLLAVRECQLETRTISIMERIEEVIECKADEARRGKKEKTGQQRQQQQQQKAFNILMQVWGRKGRGCGRVASGELPATC